MITETISRTNWDDVVCTGDGNSVAQDETFALARRGEIVVEENGQLVYSFTLTRRVWLGEPNVKSRSGSEKSRNKGSLSG